MEFFKTSLCFTAEMGGRTCVMLNVREGDVGSGAKLCLQHGIEGQLSFPDSEVSQRHMSALAR
eukprot:6467451-Amphidinium_carterae.1